MESANNGMCRCCASEGTFKDVKTKYLWMGEEEIYSDMLKECFDITLFTSESGCNGGICEVCITQLRNAANFKRQVLHTEEQFKKRLQGKTLFKSDIVKMEMTNSIDDDGDSDNNFSEDFSTADYEIPIKEEIPVEMKPKKRAAKATTSKTKKPKVEDGESSTTRLQRGARIIKITAPSTETRSRVQLKLVSKRIETSYNDALSESRKNHHNTKHILLNSNANLIRCKDGRGYRCSFCTKRYLEPNDLKKHFLKEHNNDRLLKCMTPRLFEHVVKLDITFLNCSLCNKDIATLDEFIVHLQLEHNKRMFTDVKNQILPFKFETAELKCAICDAEHITFKLLQEHMNTHFGNYICDICSAGFVTHRLLLSHIKRHETGEFKCDQCGKTFANEQKRKDHTKRTHLGQGKRNKCSFCDERFFDYWKKMNHMVAEHGMPPVVLKCQACDKTFPTQRALSRHTRKYHLLERKHKCPDCEMRFFCKSSLIKHMVKHTHLRQYRCEVCLKAYGRKNTLREHMRIHLDDRRFACTHCGQAFVQKCSWKSHMRSKHGENV